MKRRGAVWFEVAAGIVMAVAIAAAPAAGRPPENGSPQPGLTSAPDSRLESCGPATRAVGLTSRMRHGNSRAYGDATNPDPGANEVPDSPSKCWSAWTVMIYMDGDNNLEGAAIDDLNELETVGSTCDVSVLVQLDRTPGYDASNGNWTGARRYYVTSDTDTSRIGSTLVDDLGEIDMGDPATLTDFIEWGIRYSPAFHYLVVIWDHGSGWRLPAGIRPFKGVAYDDTDADHLTTQELASALSQVQSVLGRNLDIVAFDACLMQMIEVDYEIRDSVNYIIGSEEVIPWNGYPYGDILSSLTDNPSMSPRALGQSLVDAYVDSYPADEVTLSSVEAAQLASTAAAADHLAVALIGAPSVYHATIEACRNSTQSYYDLESKDLYDFAQRIKANIPDSDVQTAAQAVMNAVTSAVTAEGHVGTTMAGSHGLSTYLPSPSGYESDYSDLEFATNTRWDEYLRDECAPDAYEWDSSDCMATGMSVPGVQPHHWFYPAGDVDWAFFWAEAGAKYQIGTENLDPACDTVITVYHMCGPLIASDDNSGPGLASLIEWTCDYSGPCEIKVCHYDPSAAGLDTSYDLFVRSGPRAEFSADVSRGRAPLDVSFTDQSIGAPTSWSWNFGDGGVSTEQSPHHIYLDAGMYTVILTAANDLGSSMETKAGYIRVAFSDLDPDGWATDCILACVQAGIVGGYTGGTYQTLTLVTRDQMAVFVSRSLAGGDAHVPTGPPTATFSDVPTGYWAFKYVEYAVDHHVVGGYSDGTYRPTVTVTRDQMAVFIARAIAGGDSSVPTGPSTATFPDVPADCWAFRYVEYIKSEGVTGGYPDGTYRPLVAVTRDQMAVYICRAFHLCP